MLAIADCQETLPYRIQGLEGNDTIFPADEEKTPCIELLNKALQVRSPRALLSFSPRGSSFHWLGCFVACCRTCWPSWRSSKMEQARTQPP